MPAKFGFWKCLAASLLFGAVASQVRAQAAAEPKQQAITAAPRIFHSDLLDLTFTYPASLVAGRLPSLEEQHAATARNQPADESEDYKRADQCTDTALHARRQDEPATPGGDIAAHGTVYGDQRGVVLGTEHAVTAHIVIGRVGVECVPAQYREHPEDVAAAMTVAYLQGEDLVESDAPIWYEVGKTRIHFAEAEGRWRPNGPDTKAGGNAEHRWVASFAFVSNGNVVSIVFESNDRPFLNEMLHGEIAIGKQPPASLFPASIGAALPTRPKP
jgi:hypothetical protein